MCVDTTRWSSSGGTWTKFPRDSQTGVLVVVVPFVVFFFHGVGIQLGIASIGLTPSDFVVGLLGLFLCVHLARGRRVTVSRSGAALLGTLGLLVVWHGFRIPAGGAPIRSTTLALQLVRNWLLVAVVLTFSRRHHMPVIDRLVTLVTAAVAGTSVGLWTLANTVGFDRAPMLERFHFVQEAAVSNRPYLLVRSQWLVGDPNLYGIVLVVGFFAAVSFAYRQRTRRHYLIVSVIAVATA